MLDQAIATGSLVGSVPLSLAPDVPLPPWFATDPADLPCMAADRDPELFFPEDYGLGNRFQIDLAKAACETCPIRSLCLAWALPIKNLDGVWAATTPPERRRLRRQERKPA